MEKQLIKSIDFVTLKGLKNVKINFSKHLTAIMGVNGVGKTTVIHALACIYQPKTKVGVKDYRFPLFFPPTTDSTWKDSSLIAYFQIDDKVVDKKYNKLHDRWAPRYNTRPQRDVWYIGIDTCLPEIERSNPTGAIQYISKVRDDVTSSKVIDACRYVLNIDYGSLIDNVHKGKQFLGVAQKRGLRYSSLSMGTGEQRTIKIMQMVLEAKPYSLILIDEIDLLLHECALKNLIIRLYEIAKNNNLQIIFTTHALSMQNLTDYVSIQYINKLPDKEETLEVYDTITDDIVYKLSGTERRSYRIFVEDEFSRGVVKSILRRLGKSACASIIKFGSATNAFTISAGLVIQKADLSKCLVVLDGDVYKEDKEKLDQMKKRLSGNEVEAEEKRKKAVSIIKQYSLPSDKSPEQFIHGLLIKLEDDTNEIVKTAKEIIEVKDKHRYVKNICDHLEESEESVVKEIISLIEHEEDWKKYIKPIEEWISTTCI